MTGRSRKHKALFGLAGERAAVNIYFMRRGMMGPFTSTQYLVAISQYKCGSWVHVAARILIAISRIANKV
jgi:hypothetical protein